MNVEDIQRTWDQNGSSSVKSTPHADVMRVLLVFRRNWRWILASALAFVAAAIAFLAVVQPSFTSVSRILLDEDRTSVSNSTSATSSSAHIDEYIATQVNMIHSDVITQRVIDDLGLIYDGELRHMSPDETANAGASPPDAERREMTINALKDSINVYRLDQSFVLEIAARSPNAELSQQIAQAYAGAYIDDQVTSRLEGGQRTGAWLEERIEDLRHQSLEASLAVEKFRGDNGIVSTNGQLVSDQQLTALSTQYVLAQQTSADAQARYEIFKAAVDGRDVEQITGFFTRLPDLQENSLARQYSTAYSEATDRLKRVTARWGTDNPQAAEIRTEIQRLEGQILTEAGRILASFSNEASVSRAKLETLSGLMGTAAGASESASAVLVNLRSLEQRAASMQGLYQSYLQRYQEAVQQQSLPVNVARVISSAQLPDRPIFPNKKIILAMSLVLGLGVGAAFSVGREFLDRSLRTGGEVRDTGVEFLGYLPELASGDRQRLQSEEDSADVSHTDDALFTLIQNRRYQFTEPDRTVRHLRIACGGQSFGRTGLIGVSSIRQGEGKTTLALELARLAGRNGRRVLLIDGNSADPQLSRRFAEDRSVGLSHVLRSDYGLAEAVVPLALNVDFLPVSQTDPGTGRDDLVTAPSVSALVDATKGYYDLTLVDLPTLGITNETHILATRLGGLFLVLNWGRTSGAELETLLHSNPTLKAKTLGVVLNRTNASRLRTYASV